MKKIRQKKEKHQAKGSVSAIKKVQFYSIHFLTKANLDLPIGDILQMTFSATLTGMQVIWKV